MTTSTRWPGASEVTALVAVKAKLIPLVKRTPTRFRVTVVEMFLSSRYSSSWVRLVLAVHAAGLYITSVMRRYCCAGLGLDGTVALLTSRPVSSTMVRGSPRAESWPL